MTLAEQVKKRRTVLHMSREATAKAMHTSLRKYLKGGQYEDTFGVEDMEYYLDEIEHGSMNNPPMSILIALSGALKMTYLISSGRVFTDYTLELGGEVERG